MKLGSEVVTAVRRFHYITLTHTKEIPCTERQARHTTTRQTAQRMTEAGFDLENYVSFSYQPEQGLDG
jgi:hypothetical protein